MANISLIFLFCLYTNVFNITAERNVAVGKPTNQSSTQYGGVSSRAVDGNTSGNYYGALSCSHTADADLNWWCVDLEESVNIKTVKIYNVGFELTRFQYRLQAFEIKLSSSGSCDKSGFDSATSCYKDPNTIQAVYTVEECNQGTTSFTGRVVFISVNPNPRAALSVCEVEIFEKCSVNCKNSTCDTSGVCNGCIGGSFGNQCNKSCSTLCNGGCIQSNGICNGCIDGRFGNQCDQQCNTWCNGGCNQVNGICNGCIDGRYGSYCNKTCSGCLYKERLSTCDRNGDCYHGCIGGKSGSKCDKICKEYCAVCQRNDINSCLACTDGRFGMSCNEICNTNCASATQESNPICNITSGLCTEGCKNGFHGRECKTRCNEFCQNTICDQINGSCSKGCVPGKTGDDCTEDCRDGRYDYNCSNTCGKCADNIRCDKVTGSCGLVGCQEGYTGPKCQTEETSVPCDEHSISPLVAGIIGTLSVTNILSLSCFIAYCIYRRRKLTTRESATRNKDTLQMQSTIQCEDRIEGTEGYQNISPENTSAVYINHPTPQAEANEYETLGQQETSQYEALS